MISVKRVADIYSRGFCTVDVLDGVSKIKLFLSETGNYYYPVMDGDNLVGVITYKELLRAHPNRIVADTELQEPVVVPAEIPLWQAQEIFEDTGVEVLLVQESGQFSGILPRNLLDKHLGPHTDLLTGLYKSDYIYYHGAKLLKDKQEISIIFFDINDFGTINKAYGHTVGDLILIEVSKLLRENIPTDVFLCRFGGDEFAVLLAAHVDEAAQLANRLANVIGSHDFCHRIKISISAGIIGGRRYKERNDDPWNTIEDLMNMASLRSTEAKKTKTSLLASDIEPTNEIAFGF